MPKVDLHILVRSVFRAQLAAYAKTVSLSHNRISLCVILSQCHSGLG